MDGMTYFGRSFITEKDKAAADRRALWISLAMTVALIAVSAVAVLALNATGLMLPGVDSYGAIAVGA